MYELYIQDTHGTFQLADLGSEKPAINIQRNDLGELKDRQTDYSQALKLPKTPTNCRIFSFIDEFTVTAPKIYGGKDPDYSKLPDIRNTYIACRLYIDGSAIIDNGGCLKITQLTTDHYEVQLLGGIKGFFTQLQDIDQNTQKQKTLNDLAFTGGIVRGIAGFRASQNPNATDVFFGIADFAEELGTLNYSHYNNVMQQNAQYPWIKYKAIINQILKENGGYKLETNIADNIKYKNACIPFNSIKLKTDLAQYENSIQYFKFEAKNRRVAVFASYTPTTTGVKYITIVTAGTLKNSEDNNPYVKDGVYRCALVVHLKGTKEYDKNTIKAIQVIESNGDFTLTTTFRLTFTSIYSVDFVFADIAFLNGIGSIPFFSLAFDLDLSTSVSDVQYGEVGIGGEIPIAGNLPQITQYDFFKDFIQMYGLTLDIDSGTIYAHTFDKVIQNKAKAKDWSTKYNKGSGNVKHQLGNYVQTNNVKYADQSNDLSDAWAQISEDVARYYFEKGKRVWYASESGGNPCSMSNSFIESQAEYYVLSKVFKEGEATIVDYYPLKLSDQTLNAKPNDMITFAAEVTKNIVRTRADGVRYNYAKIKRLNQGEFPDNPSLRLCLYYQDDNAPDADRAREYMTIANEATNAVGCCTLYALSTEIGNISLSAQSMVEDFYGAFQEHVLNDIRVIEDAEFHLTPKDIHEYNPFIPVYIDYYGAYFYINKIKNFVSGKLTKVDLVKI